MRSVRLPGWILPGQRAAPGTLKPPSYMCPLPPRHGPLFAPLASTPPLSEVKMTRVFVASAGAVERVEHFADAGIEVLDQRDQLGAFLRYARLALLHLLQPLRRRLDRVVGRVVGQVEEERPSGFGRASKIFARPAGEDVRRVALGIDDFLVAPHEVVAVTPVRPVIVHHVAEKAVKEIKAPLGRRVGRADAEMPFADQRGVVAGRLEQLWQQRRAGQ